MNASTLHLLWSVVLENSPESISHLPENLFVKHLLEQMNAKADLSRDEQTTMQSYLKAKRNLILAMIQG